MWTIDRRPSPARNPLPTDAIEAVCETCTFFQTSIEFRPTLQRQHDYAAEHDQAHRADLLARLLIRLDEQGS
jgi:hypothetical protein